MKTSTLIALLLLLSGCMHRPPGPGQNFREDPNGVSANSSISPYGLTIPISSPRRISFEGRVSCGEGIAQRGINGAIVKLSAGEKILGQTSTATNGHFLLVVETELEGKFALSAQNKCGKISRVVSTENSSAGIFHELVLK